MFSFESWELFPQSVVCVVMVDFLIYSHVNIFDSYREKIYESHLRPLLIELSFESPDEESRVSRRTVGNQLMRHEHVEHISPLWYNFIRVVEISPATRAYVNRIFAWGTPCIEHCRFGPFAAVRPKARIFMDSVLFRRCRYRFRSLVDRSDQTRHASGPGYSDVRRACAPSRRISPASHQAWISRCGLRAARRSG